MCSQDNFIIYSHQAGLIAHIGDRVDFYGCSTTLSLREKHTNFMGFSLTQIKLTCEQGSYHLPVHSYFCFDNYGEIAGRAIIIATKNYSTQFQIGVLEKQGRYRYIDGCTDSLLIPPLLKGDPCLNALYFPKGINQTQHTHPSFRLGMIISGQGECLIGNKSTPKSFPLEAGILFQIPTEKLHSFRTVDSEMVVLAYHPDSDLGMSDRFHPMINRTMINGISASYLR